MVSFRGETNQLNKATRSQAPGQFVSLVDGMVHYEMVGPADAQTVVLVHGFSVPYYIWDPTFAALTEAGFRVLRYDLYGRGYSDRPDVVYGQDLYDRQLVNLLQALHIEKPVDLVGLSMGGPIATTFTDRHPSQVRRLMLIDPAGFTSQKAWSARLIQMPVLGEWLLNWFGDKILVSKLDQDFYQPAQLAQFTKKYRTQMQYKGFKRALLSTLRSGILGDLGQTFFRVGQQKRPVLLIWGEHDHTVPFALNEKVRAAIPHAEFHAIAQAAHIPHYERPEIVNPILLRFLSNELDKPTANDVGEILSETDA